MDKNRQDFIVLWCWMSLKRCWAFQNAGIKQDSVINWENFAFHHKHLTLMYKHTSMRSTPMLDTLWSYAQLLQPLEQSTAAATLWTSSRLNNPNTQPLLFSPCPHSLPSPSQPLKLPFASYPTEGCGFKSWLPALISHEGHLARAHPVRVKIGKRVSNLSRTNPKEPRYKDSGPHSSIPKLYASCPVIALICTGKRKLQNKTKSLFFFSTIHPHLSGSRTHACPAGFSDGHACKTSVRVTT